MTALTHDVARGRLGQGLVFALVSAASFGASGSLARGLLDAGWSAGAATLIRVAIAAVALAVPAVLAMRGRWHLLRSTWPTIVAYGVFAVAGCQLFYFMAVGHLDVGVALLIEYMAPVVVIGWMWVTQGSRPGALTLGGALLAMAGMVLLLDLIGGAGAVDLVGVGWAMLAMVGASVYFVIGGDTSTGLPPVMLAWGGLVVASIVLAVAAVTGLVPFAAVLGAVQLLPLAVPWWVAAGVLGVVTAAIAYVAGIAATRRLGARLGSFVSLTEVIAAATFAWLLLGQAPAPIQFAGAALILGGVILVKLGEPAAETTAITPQQVPDAMPDAIPAAVLAEVAAGEGIEADRPVAGAEPAGIAADASRR
ncbi:DMT family transporter [Demequina sp. SYSU T00039]|uniref:DMT family transporter n=1 Tax=Demequina lignilytica TaxID=3051663 RepID=A0AAW7M6L2_9MICO|nr:MULTISPECIES: DMT family transporter [unclassified Demequina]MDN4477668.1 DMT family transporter [Demequina sp. SYSU T00039-1]MDN4487981.1 DMT family transporter [Demequina sp. SYSU T00039]MDN4490421.1 DMT family transporter [Demequina sp. SYSU T00068]